MVIKMDFLSSFLHFSLVDVGFLFWESEFCPILTQVRNLPWSSPWVVTILIPSRGAQSPPESSDDVEEEERKEKKKGGCCKCDKISKIKDQSSPLDVSDLISFSSSLSQQSHLV